MLRILHVGIGSLGRLIVGDLHERELGEVVAAVDASDQIAGKKLAEIVPEARTKPGALDKIVVLKSLDEIRDWKSIDAAIVSTSSSLESCAPTFRELLSRGVSTVSTCEELSWPWFRYEKLASELDLLARENRGRLLGTGVNPGYLMDAFPACATAISRTVRRIEVFRHQDASFRRIPFQQKIGVGLDEVEFAREVGAGRIRHVGLPESLHFLAHVLSIPIQRWEESIHPILAARPLESALGPIPKGRVCGIRQEALGFDGTSVRIRLEFAAAIGLADPHDRVLVEGEPPIDLVWKGGIHGDVATSAIALNALAPLLASPPGLHTMATIPLIRCAQPRPAAARTARRARATPTQPRS